MHQGEQLAPGMGRARLVAQIDQLVDGLLGPHAGSGRPAVAGLRLCQPRNWQRIARTPKPVTGRSAADIGVKPTTDPTSKSATTEAIIDASGIGCSRVCRRRDEGRVGRGDPGDGIVVSPRCVNRGHRP
jgi:hypothetical protein